MKRAVRRLLEPFARIFRWFFDPRFFKLESALADLSRRQIYAESVQKTQFEAINDGFVFIDTSLKAMERRLDDLQGIVEETGQALAESRRQAQAPSLEEVGALLREAVADSLPRLPERPSPIPRRLADLSERDAQLLNFADSHLGYKAQVGLWINSPLRLEYKTGSVFAQGMNERMLEIPFVIAAISQHLGPNSEILDVGSAESLISLYLAGAGYSVTSLDLRPYPIAHPNLRPISVPLQEWKGPERPFDGIVCLSSIEHFGLGAYGEENREDDLDVKAMRMLHRMTREGGVLVFTAPYGAAAVSSTQRAYDQSSLEQLLHGWELVSESFGIYEDGVWTLSDQPPSDAGVVLLTARKA